MAPSRHQPTFRPYDGKPAPDHDPDETERIDATWRRLPDSDEEMGRQLAHTEALFAGLAQGAPATLRWYIPRRPALVLGRSQGPRHADLEAAARLGIGVYRRTSGGGAVLVDEHALSLDIALPAGHPLALRDVTRAYQWVGEVWTLALYTLGIPEARPVPTEEVRAMAPLPTDDPLRLACYGTLSPWEVAVGARKVVGLSQVRRPAGVIYPIGVHLRWQPERLASLLALPGEARSRLAARLRETAAGLDELAGHHISADEAREAFERALVGRVGAALRPGDWLPTEHEAAEQLWHDEFRPLA